MSPDNRRTRFSRRRLEYAIGCDPVRRPDHRPGSQYRAVSRRVIAPITIARPKSIAAAQQALREQRPVGILLQRNAEVDDPGPDDLHRICTVANIVRYLTGPDESHHIVCQGVQRARILDFLPGTPFPAARVLHIPEPTTTSPEIEARFLNLQRQADRSGSAAAAGAAGAGRGAAGNDLARARSPISRPPTWTSSRRRSRRSWRRSISRPAMEKVSRYLAERLEVLRLSNEIGQQTKAAFDERQREAILREQMATIQRQLGEGDGKAQEVAELNEAIAKAKMPPEAESQARKELRRYERMPEAAAEAGMVRSYLDWLIDLPWALPEEKAIDIAQARRILDEDHFGLEKIKSADHRISCRAQAGAATARRRSSASSARPASARRRSDNRSHARWTGRSSASASAAFTTRRKSAATGAPISAPCPATSSRPSRKPARATA